MELKFARAPSVDVLDWFDGVSLERHYESVKNVLVYHHRNSVSHRKVTKNVLNLLLTGGFNLLPSEIVDIIVSYDSMECDETMRFERERFDELERSGVKRTLDSNERVTMGLNNYARSMKNKYNTIKHE